MEGTYEILGVIGRSGLGTLYRARFQGESAFTKLVTLKMLDDGVADTDEVACRLRDEARVLGFLKHRAIVQVDRLARLAGRWTLVQEHVDGVDLDTIIERGPMPAGPALEITATVAGALHAAYTTPGPDGSPLRLQHRDIKPPAVLVDAYGAPRVTDFGIARACFTGREARTRSFVVGSFEYMSPERLALEEGGPWSDIYSLGQVLYALLMGHCFGRSHPSQQHHKIIIDKAMDKLLSRPGGVDEGVLSLLGRMLSMEPHERPDARSVERSCHEMVRRLEDETLRAWAEQFVEPLLLARDSKASGGLVGRILREGEDGEPDSVPPAPPDPSHVVEPSSKPRPKPKGSPRRELEPLPVHTFSAPSGDDDATEIMVRPEAGGASLFDDDDDDQDATEVFTAPQPAAGDDAAPRKRPPVGSVEELFESVTSTHVPQGVADEIDLSAPRDEAPVFRGVGAPEPEPLVPPSEPRPIEPTLTQEGIEDESLHWPVEEVSEPIEVSESAVRPTVVDESPVELSEDLGRPTVVGESGPPAAGGDGDEGTGARPTSVSWFADELSTGHLTQEPSEVTAVTPPEISDELHPKFERPAGLNDERTAIGPEADTARAQRPEMAQVRFDMPAGALDEHTAVGDDIEHARAEQGEMAQVRFDVPAGSLDQPTALGADAERERDDQAAMPQVRFEQPETTGAPPVESSLPPALDMPSPTGSLPPPPADPLPPPHPYQAYASADDTAEPSSAPPPFDGPPPPPPLEELLPPSVEPPAPPAEPPPPLEELPPPPAPPPPPPAEPPPPPAEPPPPPAEPPVPPAEPPPPWEEPPEVSEPATELAQGPPPPPPPPPPASAGSDPMVGDRNTHSNAQPWVPGDDASASGDRLQFDDWQPPSFDTLSSSSEAEPEPSLPPAPMPELPVAVDVRVEDEPSVQVEVEIEDDPPFAPAPLPHEPDPVEPQDTTVSGDADTDIAAPAAPLDIRGPVVSGDEDQPPARRKGKSKIIIILVVLVLLALLGVVVVAGAGAALYFLL